MKKHSFNCPLCGIKVDTNANGGNDWGWARFAPKQGDMFPTDRPVCADCETAAFDDAGYLETPEGEGSTCG